MASPSALDGLRGVAASAVFLVHFQSQVSKSSELNAAGAHTTAPWLWSLIDAVRLLGPDIFIALSGFLLCRTLACRERPFFEVMGRRVLRLFPLYLITLGMYIASSFFFRPEPHMPADGSAIAVYLIQNALALPLAFGIEPMMSAAWTIGVLIVCYVGFSVSARLLRICSLPPSSRAASYALAMLIPLSLPPTRLSVGAMLFLAGAAAREFIGVVPRSRRVLLALFALVCAAFALRLNHAMPSLLQLIARAAAAAVPVACVSMCRVPLLTAVLELSPLRWFGRMSYSFYLLHSGVLVTLRHLTFGTAAAALPMAALVPVLFIAALAATVGCSALLYRALEVPLRSLTKAHFKAREAGSTYVERLVPEIRSVSA